MNCFRIEHLLSWVLLLLFSGSALADEISDQAQERYESILHSQGSECLVDEHCLAPLRCIQSACTPPRSMTGLVDETTPFVRCSTVSGPLLYYLELAIAPQERNRGLMFRPFILPQWGMLFVFEGLQRRSFWMQNTYIVLDMVFLDSDGIVVGVIEGAEPLTQTSRAVEQESQYVLEVNAGEISRTGLSPGNRCEFINMPSLRTVDVP